MKVSEKYIEYGISQLRVERALTIAPFQLSIFFSNGETVEVDFKTFITTSNKPDIKKFKDQNQFNDFRIENGNLVWGDFEMIFPIYDLYSGTIS